MTHAYAIQSCRFCLPSGFDDAVETMEAVLLGKRDEELWLCPQHREQMNNSLQEASDGQ
jgi:hypothetical protein